MASTYERVLKRAAPHLYEREIDLIVGRRLAHLIGLHGDWCRGSETCNPFRSGLARAPRFYRNGWYRL